MTRLCLLLVPLFLLVLAPVEADELEDRNDIPRVAPSRHVKDSLHNLSSSSRGRFRSRDESEICIFCHTTHDTAKDAPLWNRYSSGAAYTPYQSSTAKASFGQPTGSSRLCLSCHDGTVALGKIRSRKTEVSSQGRIARMPRGRANLGTDLSDDHPISFRYDSSLARSNGELADPMTLPRDVRLDQNKELQCTTCHNAHNNEYGKFLVMDNTGSALCTTCHEKEYWDTSSHRNSRARWNGRGPDPWPHTDDESVAANACENCHRPHTAGTPERLLNFRDEEDNCLRCHNGNVAAKNIEADFNKRYAHPIEDTSGEHDPTENVRLKTDRHVECVDCHNPHATSPEVAKAPYAPGPIMGVPGINAAGNPVKTITYEYELCFRCHADSPGKDDPLVIREDPETNTRLEFAPGNASFHPVVAKGKNSRVTGLKDDYTESSHIYCSDCHSSDNRSEGNSSKDAYGPHGSRWPGLLERRFETENGKREQPDLYDLCYKCHDRRALESDDSGFPHRVHVWDAGASCATCHDPHGSKDNTHLINFNRKYVEPSATGRLEWEDLGDGAGSCALTCHGANHDPFEYPYNPLLPNEETTP